MGSAVRPIAITGSSNTYSASAHWPLITVSLIDGRAVIAVAGAGSVSTAPKHSTRTVVVVVIASGLVQHDTGVDRRRRFTIQFGEAIAQTRAEVAKDRHDGGFIGAMLRDMDDDPVVGERLAAAARRLHAPFEILERRLEQLEWRRTGIKRVLEKVLQFGLKVATDAPQTCAHVLLPHLINPSSLAAVTSSPATGAAARAPYPAFSTTTANAICGPLLP